MTCSTKAKDSITVLVNIYMLDDVIITLADKCDKARHNVLDDLHPLLFADMCVYSYNSR